MIDLSYTSSGLVPNTQHTYRIRARNTVSMSEWSPPIIATLTSPVYVVNCMNNEVFSLVFSASEIEDIDNTKFTVIYNPDELEAVDLCSITQQTDLVIGNVDGTDLRIIQFTPGTIVFSKTGTVTPGKTFNGFVNSIQFRSKINGQTTITYSIR